MKRKDVSDLAVRRRKKFDQRASEYREMLVGLVIRMTADRELAQDIAQQTIVNYLRLIEADSCKEDIKNEKAYLRKAARNLVMDRWKVLSKIKSVSLDQDLDPLWQKLLSQHTDRFDVEMYIYLQELRQTIPLKTILGGFSESQLRLLLLRDVEEWSYEEIGEVVNEDPIIVRYKHQRIHATIRARVKKIFGDDTSFFKSGA